MADKLLTITNRVDNVLADFDSPPVFRDPTLSYGLRRTDTLAVVTPPLQSTDIGFPTAWTRTDEGVYEYTLTGLVDGVEYEYWIEYVRNGATTRIDRLFIAGTSTPSCYMFTLEELQYRFGVVNVVEASNRDEENANDIDEDTVQQSMNYACDQVEKALTLYEAPITVVDKTVKEWAMVICMENMFSARGDNVQYDRNPYKRMVDGVYKEMSLYGTNIRSLSAAKKSQYTFTPSQI